jgi:hypothetical protein
MLNRHLQGLAVKAFPACLSNFLEIFHRNIGIIKKEKDCGEVVEKSVIGRGKGYSF